MTYDIEKMEYTVVTDGTNPITFVFNDDCHLIRMIDEVTWINGQWPTDSDCPEFLEFLNDP